MKKLGKMSLGALRENYPVLSEEDMRAMIGGDNSSDCLFQSISQVTGYSVEDVQSVYVKYLQEQYGLDSSSAHGIVDVMGVNSKDLGWMLNQFGMKSSSHLYSDGTFGIMILYGGHAVNFQYTDAQGNYFYYDAQNQTWGYVNQKEVYGTYRYDGKAYGWENSGSNSYSYAGGDSSYSYNYGGDSSYSYNNGGDSSYSYNNGGGSSYSYNNGYSSY